MYVTQDYYQAGEGVGKQNVRMYLHHSGTLPLQSLSLSSDEESESEEVIICTQSQDETLPSRPQMVIINVHPRKQGVSRVRITSRISLDAIVLRNSVYSLVLESGI